MPDPYPASAIDIRQGGKTFTGGTVALEAIDLMVQPGEFVALIGPSGCGKTTLLRLMAGLEAATTGTVNIHGQTPRQACREHAIGVAFQRPALVPSRSARDNVRMTLEITGEGNALDPDRLLRDFGLGDFPDAYPHQLSGGMQQRVNIACALVHNPKLLLLDEPFGALDELTRESMAGWLAGVLQKTGQTAVLVTHSIDEAVILSDRVVVLSPRPGRIAEVIPVDLPRPRTERTQPDFLAAITQVRAALNTVMTTES
ncbi:MAG: ABC transporter ATP-binding protein [Opitutales bacterium]